MKPTIFMLLLFACYLPLQAQPLTQTIRGTVVEKESGYPVAGAVVRIVNDSTRKLVTMTDDNGKYQLGQVPLGRHSLQVLLIGYQTLAVDNILVNSAKEVILNFQLEESVVSQGEVLVTARKNNGDPLNDMATVSSRSFTVEETDRFAGSRGDPSRMASNFAGVQGADDSRNDIVVRGNSPAGVVWRCEGIDIPNPNHFAIPGTTGGPVSMVNNKMLASSDFYTGAFPAEFGNGIAGVFDLRLRPGNNQKREHSFQFGFLGTELLSEGPLGKGKKASYLAGYRYSSLSLFEALRFDIGTSAVPQYQDGYFKINVPFRNNASFSLWGMGGKSKINIEISKQLPEERNIYGENDRDQYFNSAMGVLGTTYTKSFSSGTFLKISAAASRQQVYVYHEYLFYNPPRDTLLNKDKLLEYTFAQVKYSTHATVNHKIGRKWVLKAGVIAELNDYSFHDSARKVVYNAGAYALDPWKVRWDTDNRLAWLLQPYVQAKYRPGERFTLNLGWHAQYFTLTNSASWLEPRVGMRYELNSRSALTFGAGLHSQTQPAYVYFYRIPGNSREHNNMLDFTKSMHQVLGYDLVLSKNLRIKTEAYYQYLYRIPVTQQPGSFSLVNTGTGFTRYFPDTLVNTGTAYNYGLELTIERFFSNSYYFLATVSLFESKYTGSDGVLRNSDFNGNYAVNLLFTKEFAVRKTSRLQTGGKLTTVGGRYYSPADTALSNASSELIELGSQKNTLRTHPYFRFDIRVSYKWNRPRVSHEFALDIVNVFNTRNVLGLSYTPNPAAGASNIAYSYQLGFLPLFYYKIDF